MLEGGDLTPSHRRGPTPQAAADSTRARGGQAEAAPGHARAIKRKAKGGRIGIDFGNENELIRIFEALTEK